MRGGSALIAMGLVLWALSGCETIPPSGTRAVADLTPLPAHAASGRIRFEQYYGSVIVTADLRGLDPAAPHAVILHERGDCGLANAAAAGAPLLRITPAQHRYENGRGLPFALPVLHADAIGRALYRAKLPHARLDWDGGGLIGKSVIVQSAGSDTAGQAGGSGSGRLGCAVIGRSD